MIGSDSDIGSTAEIAVDSRCELGEGPLWCERRASVLWTDIHAALLWEYQPRTGDTRRWKLKDRLGCFALCESGQLLLALAKGLYKVELGAAETQELDGEYLTGIEIDEPRTRTNDGRCDRAGNFVFGTLNEEPSRVPIGRFYQYSSRYGLRLLNLPCVAIPNSLAFSRDGGTIYYCCSTEHRIMCGDYDAERATISHSRTFAVVEDATPDGSTVDAEGCLWNAQWGGARVVRYSSNGRVSCILSVPVSQPSCVAFGGESLDILYITTAHEFLDAAARAAAPLSGGLFHARLSGIRGLPEARFRDV